ncbi:MAG: hypothetical protein IPP61_01340 [Cytophagaceae bacterium]|nr:hypothetical protein [Cytophagaceae bacterium]
MTSQDKKYKKMGLLASISFILSLAFFGINGCDSKEILKISKVSITFNPLAERLSFDSLAFYSNDPSICFDSIEMRFTDVKWGNEATLTMVIPIKNCSSQKLGTKVIQTLHFNPINNKIGQIFYHIDTVFFSID